MKSFTSTNSNDVFFSDFPHHQISLEVKPLETGCFHHLVVTVVFFQTSMSRPGSRRSPCKPSATPPWGVSTQCVWMNSLHFNARSTRRWWLALSKTPRPPIGELIRSVSCFAISKNFARGIRWYDMDHLNSYTFIHWMPCSFASLLMNCKKTCCIIKQICKKKLCFDQFMPKEIHPTWLPSSISSRLSSVAMVASGIIRESSFCESENPWFFFLIPWFFFELEDPQIWEVCATWKSWKSKLMKYNLKSVVNVWYSLPDYSFDDDKKSPDSHIYSWKRSHVYSLGFFYVF